MGTGNIHGVLLPVPPTHTVCLSPPLQPKDKANRTSSSLPPSLPTDADHPPLSTTQASISSENGWKSETAKRVGPDVSAVLEWKSPFTCKTEVHKFIFAFLSPPQQLGGRRCASRLHDAQYPQKTPKKQVYNRQLLRSKAQLVVVHF